MKIKKEANTPLSTQPKIVKPCQREEILNRLAMNEPHRSIAKDFDVSQQRISQINKKDREVIESIAQKIVEDNLPDVYETTRADVKTTKRIALKANQDIESVTKKNFNIKRSITKLMRIYSNQ